MKKILLLSIILITCYSSFSQDFGIEQARREISIYDGVNVYLKGKSLTKYGFNPNIDGDYETIWYQGGNEVYATSNTISKIVSSNSGDGQLVAIEGHTIDGDGVMTFVVQTATLTGQTSVDLTTPLYRATRIRNIGSTNFAGVIYVFSSGTVTGGVPQDATKIHVTVPIGYNRSQKASTSLSSEDYWVITQITGSVGISSGNNRVVDFWVEVREYGKVFERVFPFTASNVSGDAVIPLCDPIIVKPRSDVRVVAISSGAGTQVKASLEGYLLKISE